MKSLMLLISVLVAGQAAQAKSLECRRLEVASLFIWTISPQPDGLYQAQMSEEFDDSYGHQVHTLATFKDLTCNFAELNVTCKNTATQTEVKSQAVSWLSAKVSVVRNGQVLTALAPEFIYTCGIN